MKFYTTGINLSGWLGIAAVCLILLLTLAWNQGLLPTGLMVVFTDEPRVTTGPATPLPVREDSATSTVITSETGVFREYDPAHVASRQEGDQIVLFFTSVTCTSCQTVEASIISEQADIPARVHILHVDFTTAPQLRRQYDVRTPHTFVEIARDGTKIQSWTASRDLQAILARL